MCNVKTFVSFCDWYLNLKCMFKNIPKNIFTFSNFKFTTFSTKKQFGELFQKRFATGICDLRGVHAMYRVTPYTVPTKNMVC